VLTAVTDESEACLGVYAEVESPGAVVVPRHQRQLSVGAI